MSLPQSFSAMLIATLLVTFALHAHAEELQGDPASIRGLVVSSGNALIINDGARDYILLGVDDPDYEGKICEAFGVIGISDGVPTLGVITITIIASEYPDEDLVGTIGGFGSPFSQWHWPTMQEIASASTDVALVGQCNVSLPIRDGSGMRALGDVTDNSRTACRFQHLPKTRTR